MSDNPFDLAFKGFTAPEAEPEVSPRHVEAEEFERFKGLITAAGAYEDIPNGAYHGVELCPEHSIHGSGLFKIEEESCAAYWETSLHNPGRQPQPQKSHFSVGHLLHDILLYKGMVPDDYHIVPDGFVRAHRHKWTDEIEGYDEAIAAGRDVLTKSEFNLACDMAEACDKNSLASALIMAGKPEVSIAAQDPKTGRWMLTRPDILPDTMEIIPDVKGVVSAAPPAYETAATRWGYFQWAANCLDILDLVFGEAKRQFVHIAIEKKRPHLVEIYTLDEGHIHEARLLNRRALDLFDRSLTTGEWLGYSTPENPILPLPMAPWKIKQIQRRVASGELSYDL
ncbi:MAG: hypothetical protein QOH47_2379 [Sphingomonadales bacterium]|nr:hypothetical protein [Sphingomonadales bacterium]